MESSSLLPIEKCVMLASVADKVLLIFVVPSVPCLSHAL